MDHNLLKLMAQTEEDLGVLSACLQDALVPVKEILYDSAAHRFVMALNRYRWEEASESMGERIHGALVFDHVMKVQTLGLKSEKNIISLLRLHYEAPYVYMLFSDNISIRLEVTNLKVKLRDAHIPWPAKTPMH